mmetsp:Transcript_55829/g.167323  ORF Transcript_55829/g.167323 Transcript_55829/m.167323 type:complete len:516 (-) Transcript_55829:145-1692(-)
MIHKGDESPPRIRRGGGEAAAKAPKETSHPSRRAATLRRDFRGALLLSLAAAAAYAIALNVRAERLLLSSHWPSTAGEEVGRTQYGGGFGPPPRAEKKKMQEKMQEKEKQKQPRNISTPRRRGAGTNGPPRITTVAGGAVRNNLRATRRRSRTIEVSKEETERARRLTDDDLYDSRRRPDFPRGCEPLRPWQTASFPSCNVVHEVDRTVEMWSSGRHKLTNQGGYNMVFAVREDLPPPRRDEKATAEGGGEPSFAVKEIEYSASDANDRMFADVQMDALVMERLTSSPYVMDVHAHCGLTLAVAWGEPQLGGLIFDGRNPSRETKLRLAVQVSSALADVENADGDGVAPYMHMDYMVRQHLVVNGTLKLSDFNRGQFVTKQRSEGGRSSSVVNLCTSGDAWMDGTFRSPEEYLGLPLTAKAQVFSLGNILQSILTGVRWWNGVKDDEARDRIKKSGRYEMPRAVIDSRDPIDVALRNMTMRCLKQNPKDRPSAMEVAMFLREEAERLGVDVSERL